MRSRTIAGLGIAGVALLAACGQAAGGSTSGAAPTPAAAPTTNASGAVHVGHSSLGVILVDANGRTLYGFTNDKNGMSSCDGTCAQSWPPLLVGAGWKAGAPVGAAKLHTVMRTDGTTQLGAGKWPLYVFSGDTAAGDVNGEGALGKWFVVRPDGSLLKNPAAAAPTTAAPSVSGMGY